MRIYNPNHYPYLPVQLNLTNHISTTIIPNKLSGLTNTTTTNISVNSTLTLTLTLTLTKF